MPVQDDTRETEQRELFGLIKPDGEGRSGVDAILRLGGRDIPFELKSTTNGSVTTVRDFGFDHIKKWSNKHWLISKYSKDGARMEYTLYGSPLLMSKWIKTKENYIKSDFQLANIAPINLTTKHLFQLIGRKKIYTLEDARKLNKKQYKIAEYRDLMDVKNGYSPKRMLSILQNRCKYLIERGATLNNPHIPASYFKGWERITKNHAERLIEMVNHSLRT